jgi:hypothetical protein
VAREQASLRNILIDRQVLFSGRIPSGAQLAKCA